MAPDESDTTHRPANALPCPFCGSREVGFSESISSSAPGYRFASRVVCIECGAAASPALGTTQRYADEQAAVEWNTRTSVQP